MTGIAVVASAHDAKFAEEVHAALQAAGREASVSPSLPKAAGLRVILIWSAALEAARVIDAQALIGLWSEDRLVVARRDATPLPLGLRDLPSLSPGTTAAEICAAVPGARGEIAALSAEADRVFVGSMAEAATVGSGQTGGQEVELEFWRAIKDGNDPDNFELYVQQFPNGTYASLAKRKLATLRSTAPEGAKTSRVNSPLRAIIAALVAIFLVGGGGWYYFNKGNIEKQATLTAALATATKASQELQQAQARQLEAIKALEQAREAESLARKSGDSAKLLEVQGIAKRAEAEAAKQAEAVKQREAAVADARKKAQDASSSAKSAKAEPRREVVAAEPRKQAASKQEAPVETKTPETKPEAAAPMDSSRMTRSQREQIASSAPSAPAPADPQAKAASDSDALYQQAVAMEQEGKAAESVRIYRRAARAGSGKAAKRLGEIYDKGVPGVSRDYAESLQWYETARQLGERIETAGGSRGAAAPAPEKAAAAKSAPPVREPPKAAPVPAAKPAPAPEPVKAAEPAPAPAPETKPGWFSIRGLLIALLVLGLIAWRRARRREKALARQSQPPSAAATEESRDLIMMGAPRSVYRPDKVAPPGDAALFVSYSHKDRPRVEPIVSVIEEMGRRVWMDRNDITGQTGWAGQIVRAIRECRAVVLMASPNSYNSDQVVRELYLAMNHRKTIVPIEIEPADMPDELQYILAPFQHHRLSGGETRAVLGRALAAV